MISPGECRSLQKLTQGEARKLTKRIVDPLWVGTSSTVVLIIQVYELFGV
jgi:hypothetical protein